MKRANVVCVLLSVLVGLSACGSGGSGGGSACHDGAGEKFLDALFEGRFDDAKTMALADFAEQVSSDVDGFTAIAAKYDFKDHQIVATPPWGTTPGANPEGDRNCQVTFLFSPQGTETWKTGQLDIRALLQGGKWGIADLRVMRPKE
jgi:hypothetical protein